MSALSRLRNLLRRRRIAREIDEELESHLAEAIENGRDPEEARRALGSQLRLREESLDAKLATGLESWVSDLVFGWRQIKKHRATSAAATLSLALALGACGATFQIVDALLLRPLPVAEPDQLFAVEYHGHIPDWLSVWRENPYPTFRTLRDAVDDEAQLVASSRTRSRELRFDTADALETAHVQYVSGGFFPMLGLDAQLGRVLGASDDVTPGGHPVAVVSQAYWEQRFGSDPDLRSRTFNMAGTLFEIVGVVRGPFTGIEPGVPTDIFVPTMMARNVEDPDQSGFRILGRWREGHVREAATRDRLESLWRTLEHERWTRLQGAPPEWIDRYVSTTRVHLKSAAGGFSTPQETYAPALGILAGLAALLFLIACANVSNVLLGLATQRSRELALRVAIGAGRFRVIRLLVAEAWWLGILAAGLGVALSGWLARWTLKLLRAADLPLRLDLTVDARTLLFFTVAALATSLLCGLGPALHSSAVSFASG
ncbi:MAG: ABC transporter permease, partial [Acidobacteriota bacterium]